MGEPLEAVEGSDSEISRLFPKCRPRSATHTPTTTTPTTTPSDARRSDLNLNCVLDSDDNDNYETETITTAGDLPTIYDNSKLSRDSGSSGRMSVDSGSGSRSGSTPGSRSGSHSGSHSESTKMERSAEDVDMDMDVSVVSGYDEYDERYMRSSVLDSSYEEPPPPPPTSRPQAPRREHFRLRDSRIEIAGGREVFSHSRSRPARRRHDESQRRGSQQVQHQQYPHDRQQQEQQWPESPGDSEGRGRGSSVRESPLVYETRLTGSSEVVFDDIGEWVARGLTVRALDDRPGSPSSPTADHQVNPAEHGDHGYLAAYERSTSPSDSDSTQGSPHKVTKIGNVPIAEYEGSPRRYGPRPSPRTHSPRGPHSHHGPPPRPPRPGFPRRVLAEEAAAREAHEAREALPPAEVSIPPRAVEETGQVATQEDGGGGECPPDSSCSEGGSMSPAPPVIAISTLTSSYSTNLAPQQDASRVDSDMYDYSYEMSETRKVLEEFFKEQGGSRGDEFLDLEYHLKRQQGNSYVGLRLAAEYAEDQAEGAPEECPSDQKDGGSEQHSNAPDHRSDIPEHHSSNAEHHSSVSEHHQEASEHQHASGTEQQRREQQCNSGSSAAHGLEPDLDATTYEVSSASPPHHHHHHHNHLHHHNHHQYHLELSYEAQQEAQQDHVQHHHHHQSVDCNSNCSHSSNSGVGIVEDPLNLEAFPEAYQEDDDVEEDVDDENEDDVDEEEEEEDVELELEGVDEEEDEEEEEEELDLELEEIDEDEDFQEQQQQQEEKSALYDRLNEVVAAALGRDSLLDGRSGDETASCSAARRPCRVDIPSSGREDQGGCCDLSTEGEHDAASTNPETEDLPQTEVGLQVGHSRNFTLSPETTSCDSGDVESDYSGVDPEGSIHSSSRGICSAMPVLEDGLSSGDESGMDEREETKEVLYEKEKQDEAIIEQEQHHHQRPIVRSLDEQLCRGELPPLNPLPTLNSHNSPLPNAASSPHSKVHSRNSPHTNTQSPSSSTLTLMKKQITEIEREIALRKPEGGPRRGGLEGDGPHPPLDLHLLDPLNEKVIEPPPPPAPHPHRGGSTGNSSVVENGSSSSTPIQMPTTAVSPSRVLGHLHSPQYTPGPSTGPHLLSAMGSLTSPVQHQVTPHMVPGHPAAHDILHNPGGGVGQSRESVEAAIADIKQAIRRTKNMTLKSHPQERSPINDKGPVWIPRNNRREPQQQQQQQQPQQQQPPPQPQTPQQQQQPPSCQQSQQQSPQSQQHSQLDVAEASRTPEHVRHEDGEWRRLHIRQEDGDTDQETDRLLGQQRSDDPGFYDEKGWRRPKTRTVMPRAANHKANGGGATSNGSTPSTPIGQGHQVSANQTPSTPPDMAASNKNKNKKVIGGCLLSLKHLCNDRKCTLHAPCSKFVDV
ncbi:uncharacterized protein [Penaeus vannamei]|uniref:uncharacterized protein isoform X3 n=1 Tax=Penaeus vannamei TaxID=6689 RepID=UPI00387F4D87